MRLSASLLEGVDVEIVASCQASGNRDRPAPTTTYSTVAKPWLKVRAASSRSQQILRHRLAGAVMHGKAPQHLRLLQPMLVELRGQFDEVGIDTGARDQRIGHVRQQPVQRMAELVEQRARVVEAQQRRLALRALGEVHHIDDERPDVAGELLLVAQRRHPGAAMLGGAREIVAEEQADMAAVGDPSPPRPARRGARPARPQRREGQAEQPAARCRTPPRSSGRAAGRA